MSADARKAVILARGLGTRMRRGEGTALSGAQARMADAGVKALIPVGRPFLDYVISALADAGLDDICLVIGPEHQAIRDHYRDACPRRVTISFAVQREPRGTADAVLAAEAFASTSPFLVLNSDNYYPVESYVVLRRLRGPGLTGFTRRGLLAGNIPPERVSAFALLDCDESGILRQIIEKPDTATQAALGGDALVGMNCWRFGPSIFPACRAIEPSPRDELELPSAVQYSIDALGERYTVIPFDGPVLDLSTKQDIQTVTAALAEIDVNL
jgi:glucose-1-phosphate thymidylyltransferase